MGANFRCLPLKNWPDTSARHQIINQIIFEEYILGFQQRKAGWTSKAKKRLEHYGIDLAESTLNSYRIQLKNGARSAIASSSFGGKLYEEIGPRVGKEGMYKQIDLLSHIFLDEPDYIGLPANQLVYVARKYGGRVVACERGRKMYEFMSNLKRCFVPSLPVHIHPGDVFSFLETTEKRFSLYDLDLMQHLYKDNIKRIAVAIARTSKPISVVSIASCVGRARTEKEYKNLMPGLFIEELKKNGCVTIEQYSDGYSDRVTPMRYELLVIESPPKITWSL